MKIGIFGDSFATKSKAWHRKENYLSWVEHLSSNYKVINHAVSGSSFFYSYLQFIHHNEKYDRIVFLVTNIGRVYLPHAQLEIHQHVPGYQHLLNYEDRCLTDDHRILHQSLMNYFIYVQDLYEEQVKQRLLIEEVRRIRPDVLLIPCFDPINGCSMPEYKGATPSDIAMIDLKTKSWAEIKGTDFRHCHMNMENNKIFADKIDNWLTQGGDFKLNIKDFVKSEKPYEFYFD